MADTKITIVCEEGEDHITDISLTAERNYTPFLWKHSPHRKNRWGYILLKRKIYSARMLLKVVQSKSYLILLNLSVTA